MIDYREELVRNLLSLGLPVQYELFLTKDTELPCISYQLREDTAYLEGDTQAYSYQSYYIKVWSKNLSELAYYSDKIDKLMRKNGFTRTSTNELWQGEIGQIQLGYRGLAREKLEMEVID